MYSAKTGMVIVICYEASGIDNCVFCLYIYIALNAVKVYLDYSTIQRQIKSAFDALGHKANTTQQYITECNECF